MNIFRVVLFGCALFLFQLNLSAKNEKRAIDPFDKISLRVAADLYLEQASEPAIEITASEQTLDKLIVENVDHKLIIRFSLEDHWLRNFDPGKIEIHVSTSEIEELNVQGSGNIIAEKKIETYALDLNIAGSGDIKMADVRCEKLKANITGSGDIIIAGNEEIGTGNACTGLQEFFPE